ncbi:MAG: hypothetical protein GY754_25885 [bacterium]|nr:hypothetical protein [bacterium]
MNYPQKIRTTFIICIALLPFVLQADPHNNKKNIVFVTKTVNRVVHGDWILGGSNTDTLYKRNDTSGKGLYGMYLQKSIVSTLRNKLVNEYITPGGTFGNKKNDPRDAAIITAVKTSVNKLYMHVPKLRYKKDHKGLPVYELKGWSSTKLTAGNKPSIEKFMSLLLAGAHFVILEPATPLLNNVTALTDSGVNKKHSHYAQTSGARVFPSITWAAHDPAPIICALLVDKVMVQAANKGTFFQLEGWPYHSGSGTTDLVMHGIDFLVHSKSYWNISTYGRSPYSEKRGTTIFITKSKTAPKAAVIAPLFKKGWDTYCIEKRK